MADKKIRRTAVPPAQGGVRLVFPMAGPPLPHRDFSFTDSQRSDIRRLAAKRLNNTEFANFVAEVEFQAEIHWALRARLRLSRSAIESAFRAESRRIANATKALRHLRTTADLAHYLQHCVEQPHTAEEYAQSVVNSGRLPDKGVPIHAKPDDANFEQELRSALKQAQMQAEAEGRVPLRKISISELLHGAENSLFQIHAILGRALSALSSTQRQVGRPPDVWRESLIFRLADLYAGFFGHEPTATADNDFHRFVDVAFDALGWPQAGRRRAILFTLKRRKGAET